MVTVGGFGARGVTYSGSSTSAYDCVLARDGGRSVVAAREERAPVREMEREVMVRERVPGVERLE